MPGFDVLDPNLSLYQNYFLEASAGTGKTFAIENLVVRMLQDPQGPKIHQILVVTFTKAATSELKRRIWQNLEKHKLTEAMRAFDEAQIFTIHGFCFHALQSHALETGFSLDQIEESGDQDVLRRIVKDYLRTEANCVSQKQLEKVLRRFQNEIDSLVIRLVSLASPRVPIVGGKNYAIFLEEINKEIDQLRVRFSLESSKFQEDLLALAPLFGKCCDRQKNLKAEVAAGLLDLVAFVERGEGDIIDSPLLLLTPDNRLKRGKEPKLHYPELLQALQERIIPMLAQASDDLVITATLAEGARRFIEEVIDREDLFFFDDLLKAMQKEVHKPTFANLLRSQYRVVLIDEFQDTDAVQWEIFSTLFAHPEFKGALYLIGDPKQSIYRFRGADLYTYLEAKKALGSTAFASLNKNFRSDPSLVEALNALFCSVTPFISLPKTGEIIECPPVEAALKQPTYTWNDEKGSIHFFYAEEEEELFSFIIEEIGRLKIPLRECAVLVKDRFQLERFASFSSYPISAKLTRSLVDSPAYTIWKDFLGAVLQPRDRNKIAQVLGGALFGYSLEQLAQGFDEQISLFFQYHELFHHQGVLALFYAVVKSCRVTEILYQDLLQLVELIVEQTHTPEEALPFLNSLKLEDPESPRLKARSMGDVEAIQVMTIHASKGLEFGVVFPVGLALAAPSKRDFVREGDRVELGEGDETEKMRLFYVACTRAKHRLYLPVLNGVTESAIQLFLKEKRPIIHSQITLSQSSGKERVSSFMKPESESLTFSSIRRREFSSRVIQSYSSLRHGEIERESQLMKSETDLPPGPETGIILHKIFEKLNFETAFLAQTPSNLEEFIAPFLKKSVLEPYLERICHLVYNALFALLPAEKPFTLASVDPKLIQKEVEFLYPTSEGYMKGFVDLFFEHGGNSYAVDWKSNSLIDYSSVTLNQVMQEHRYDLQAEIYSQALTRYLHKFSKPPLKGSFYLFLRGMEKNSSKGVLLL